MSAYEWMEVIHSACGGQGCMACRNGNELVYINTSEEQAA